MRGAMEIFDTGPLHPALMKYEPPPYPTMRKAQSFAPVEAVEIT
jgi:hypothetical protein